MFFQLKKISIYRISSKMQKISVMPTENFQENRKWGSPRFLHCVFFNLLKSVGGHFNFQFKFAQLVLLTERTTIRNPGAGCTKGG